MLCVLPCVQPSVYVLPPGCDFDDVGTSTGVIPVASSAAELVAELQAMASRGFTLQASALDKLGVPADSVDVISSAIEALM